MKKFFLDWGQIIAGKKTRWLTVVIWILLVTAVSVSWPQVNSQETKSNQLLPEDAMSVEATEIASEQFANDAGVPLLIAWYRAGGLEEDDLGLIQEVYIDLQKNPLAYQKFIPPLAHAPMQALMKSASEDGAALTTPVFFNKAASTEDLQTELDNLHQRIEEKAGDQIVKGDLDEAGLHVRFTGAAGIQTDATALFSNADVTLLIGTVVLVLVLLIMLYRSPILSVVPLIAVGMAYGFISPLLGFMAKEGWIEVDAQAVSIMTVLLFGAGTDYCLFLVSRYRDELRLEPDKYTALNKAIGNTGDAIMLSAVTTVAGLSTLALAHYASYDRFAVPFSLSIFIMGIIALTFLPAILALLGRFAFVPFIPRTEEMMIDREAKKGKKMHRPKTAGRINQAFGRLSTEKPWTIIIICVLVLGGLALFAPKVQFTYGLLDSFPEDMPSREGFEIIAEHYPPGEVAPVQVIVDSEDKDISLKKELSNMEIVQSVSEPQTGSVDKAFVQYEVTLSIDPYSTQAIDSIPVMKDTVQKDLKEGGFEAAGSNVWIGGETATLYDTQEVTSRDQSVIIPAVLIIIATLLLVYLRSIIAMLYLLATVVLSYLSAIGLGWIVIHYGYGSDAMQGLIPVYAFVFLVALGGDYNIFMVSSIWKKRKSLPLKQAIQEGVTETSGVIGSAGLILAGTFSVLAVLPMQVLVQFGTVTAIGILLDTFIVRPLLVPSITTVLGSFAFWPGGLWKENKMKDQAE